MQWYQETARRLLLSTPVHTGEVHAQDTSTSDAHATYELINETLTFHVSRMRDAWADQVWPNRPWADEHFSERVSGVPYNPPPSHVRWPYAVRDNADHTNDGVFSHTYPERFWPRHAGLDASMFREEHREAVLNAGQHHGIRYPYGDLNDVVTLLQRNPLTRQAYLPVWFPEDTGATEKQRVPCSIGYHFMIRNGVMDCWYQLRSCDFVRYLRDDVYMAGLLLRWMVTRVRSGPLMAYDKDASNLQCGQLHVTISSLHAFVGDTWKLNKIARGDFG